MTFDELLQQTLEQMMAEAEEQRQRHVTAVDEKISDARIELQQMIARMALLAAAPELTYHDNREKAYEYKPVEVWASFVIDGETWNASRNGQAIWVECLADGAHVRDNLHYLDGTGAPHQLARLILRRRAQRESEGTV